MTCEGRLQLGVRGKVLGVVMCEHRAALRREAQTVLEGAAAFRSVATPIHTLRSRVSRALPEISVKGSEGHSRLA